jgi:hypothetical protein
LPRFLASQPITLITALGGHFEIAATLNIHIMTLRHSWKSATYIHTKILNLTEWEQPCCYLQVNYECSRQSRPKHINFYFFLLLSSASLHNCYLLSLLMYATTDYQVLAFYPIRFISASLSVKTWLLCGINHHVMKSYKGMEWTVRTWVVRFKLRPLYPVRNASGSIQWIWIEWMSRSWWCVKRKIRGSVSK